MEVRIKEDEIKDIMKEAVEWFKEIIMNVVRSLAEADIVAVLHSMKDPMCMALRPQTEDTEQLLEEMMLRRFLVEMIFHHL